MNMKRWFLATGLAIAGVAAGVVGAAGATNAPAGHDSQLMGESRDRAVASALSHVGGGVVTDTESGDAGAPYAVEVRRPDGTQVEVNLDHGYAVTHAEADDDGPGDDEGPDDDADDVNDNDGPDDPDDDPGEPASDDY